MFNANKSIYAFRQKKSGSIFIGTSQNMCHYLQVMACRMPVLLLAIQIVLVCASVVSSEDIDEAAILVKFKESLENATALHNWDTSVRLCNGSTSTWNGVICFNGNLTMLNLKGLGLHGEIDVDSLAHLPNLRQFSVANNSFAGAIPDVKKLTGLRGLYLSNNGFSGDIPDSTFSGLKAIRRVVLSDNKFTGNIPNSLTKLPRLVDLQLQNNQFEGEIPDFHQANLTVNLSNNKLEGRIPAGLRFQNSSSFLGNRLCGQPLEPCKYRKKISKFAIIAIAVVALAALTFAFFFLRGSLARHSKYEKSTVVNLYNRKPDHKGVIKNACVPGKRTEQGTLYFLRDDRQKFELEDLLRASAQVLGSGNFGSSYKAELLSGPTVAVKRFRQMSNVGKEEFFEHMRRLGRLQHPNLLPLIAFYYRKDEKLLVFDFVEFGSLASHLHGKRGPNHAGLDWPTRLKIIKGVAKGLDYLYKQFPEVTLPHGHLKSSNILLDKKCEPVLADYALEPVINRDRAQQFMVAYKSPESTQRGVVTRKTDVWSLGILILELLTGRFPANYLKQGKGANADLAAWVNSVVREEWTGEVFDKDIIGTKNGEGQMLKLLKIGMCCCEWNVEKRWDLKESIEKIEELKERDSDEEYSSYGSSWGMTDDDFSFSVADKSMIV